MVVNWPLLTVYGCQLTVFSQRLKEERQRLGMNQTVFASLGGVSKDAQLNYENGSRRPDSAYLAAVAAHGIDVLYVLTGQRNVTALSADESDLVRRYREAPEVVGAAALAALAAGAATRFTIDSSPARAKQKPDV
ncbi:XRE family transcriptional regulator [Burkholderia stagnalis]|uniref:XRE family transcriptional regulator n=2 Tax=Burkholderia stagnalis TaxID=1503054 RepID=A0A108GF76_9BURK|nr:XRE family transcriptional regulator [Burkholderia stagnalis]KVN72065.1 XRE family transcriptional regulator [Burkholderia stagnalis]KVZ13569.1 XRE family transcriptional regulator [Burkholderia stagnalis]KWA52196.1 XRE family transcriptional regulator [Burkholderia stagnalis]KWA57398.1 XRE family transcriptional regulator [Burkholderia stagnalis]